MGRLAGKVAIVTGAARGTGESTARLFVREGAQVVVADVQQTLGAAVAESLGDAAIFQPLDVRSEEQWTAAVAAAEQRFGGLDVLVNNAAVLLMKALVDTSLEEYERVVAVNQTGCFLGIRAVVPALRRRGRGSIVNVSSIDGLRAQNGLAAYASSKWALRGLTRVAALELGRFGIRVNAVCPEAGGPEMLRPYLPEGVDVERVLAAQQPVLATQKARRIAERVEDVARMVAFLASDEAASCTGADFCVDGGNLAGRITPGLPGAEPLRR